MIWTFPGKGGIDIQFNERQAGFWIVCAKGRSEPSKRHLTCQNARDEAKRLAEFNPGQEFIVLKSDSCFSIKSQKAVYYQ